MRELGFVGLIAVLLAASPSWSEEQGGEDCNPKLFQDVANKWDQMDIRLIYLHNLKSTELDQLKLDKGFQSLTGVGESSDFSAFSNRLREMDEQTGYRYDGSYQEEYLSARL